MQFTYKVNIGPEIIAIFEANKKSKGERKIDPHELEKAL